MIKLIEKIKIEILILRFELRLKDLKSSVLTTTPYELHLKTYAFTPLLSLITAHQHPEWWSYLDSRLRP